jgi:hypothetical protein
VRGDVEVRVSKRLKKVSAALALTAVFTQANANFIGTDWERVSGLVTTTGPFVLQQELPAPASAGLFGEAVAMWHDDTSGVDWAVVGAPNEDGQAGAAYVFSFAPGSTEWKQEARLVASDRSDHDGSAFGYSVPIDHSTVVVGSPLHEADFFDGAAYVFVRDEATGDWSQQGDELNSADGGFGFAVAVNGDALAVSGPEEVLAYLRSGDTWSLLQTLASPTTTAKSNFGASLAMTSDALLIGAPLDGDVAASQGSAILYSIGRDGWDLHQVFRPDSSTHQFFGTSVALAADTIAIGAPISTTGAVYIFAFDDAKWTAQSTIWDTSSASEFGFSIALSKDKLVISDPGSASTSIFRNNSGSWKLDSTLVGDTADDFGWSVATAGNRVMVGAPQSNLSDGAADAFIDDRIFANGVE